MSFNFDPIVDQIFVGRGPTTADHIAQMKAAGVTAVLNLQTDQDFLDQGIDWPRLVTAYEQNDIRIVRMEIIDFDKQDLIEKLPEATAKLADLIDQGEHVYVHCTAGKERSPGTVACYLAWHRELGLARALEIVKSARDCKPFEDALTTADQNYFH